MNKIFEWIWSKLPDKCRQRNCPRTGIRGNENWIEVEHGYYEIMCDDCHAHWLEMNKPL